MKLVTKFAAKANTVGNKALIAGVAMALTAGSASASVVEGLIDWDETAANLKLEVSPAITAAFALGIAFLAVKIGYRMIRRFAS